MAIVRSLVVALALVTAGLQATDAQEGPEGRRLGPAPRPRPRPRPRPAPRPAPRPRGGDGPLFPEDIIWDIDGGDDYPTSPQPYDKKPGFTAAEESTTEPEPATTKETEEPRKEKDLSRAAPAPRPAPRPCTTTKPVLKPNPYEDASEPGDTIAATTGGGGTAEDSRKDRTLVHTVDVPIARPQDTSAGDSKEPDVDILIDSDGS